jgi:hypothetical protein
MLRVTGVGNGSGGGNSGDALPFEENPVAVTTLISGDGNRSGGWIAAQSDSRTNADVTLAGQGTGGIYFGNDGGILGAAVDPGTANIFRGYVALTPGTEIPSAGLQGHPQGGDARCDVFISPTSGGALMRVAPDNEITGGIVRGSYATDWQQERFFSTQVAKGSRSTIGGGLENETNTNALASTIAGGQFNRLDGSHSLCPGGVLGDDRGRHQTGVWGGGQFTQGGDNVAAEGILRVQTTGATPTQLGALGAAGVGSVHDLDDNCTYAVRIMMVARQVAGAAGTVGDSAWKQVALGIKRGIGVGTTALVGSVTTVASGSDAAASTWSWAVTADAVYGGVKIVFTGQADKTIYTSARVSSIEIMGPAV